MLHSEGEKCDDCYKGQSSFLLQVRLRHVNHIDCACCVVVAGRRWLGILSSARLALETAARRAYPLARGHHRRATHHAAEAAKAHIEHRGKPLLRRANWAPVPVKRLKHAEYDCNNSPATPAKEK
jgi:hypothetical protein